MSAGPMVDPCVLNVSVTGSSVLSLSRSRKSL
ncbi:ribosomal protein L34 [Rhinolophus ferrumequinum]|uniref:Ribosomal protein L34 n=1 Tax=Rhinolophus ferrumequinum TaxID=59479 RepID=A0A7J7ZDM8_RHIFE|nr:ribosomal protein L34 [Rhinolophus ferrumequinum]